MVRVPVAGHSTQPAVAGRRSGHSTRRPRRGEAKCRPRESSIEGLRRRVLRDDAGPDAWPTPDVAPAVRKVQRTIAAGCLVQKDQLLRMGFRFNAQQQQTFGNLFLQRDFCQETNQAAFPKPMDLRDRSAMAERLDLVAKRRR